MQNLFIVPHCKFSLRVVGDTLTAKRKNCHDKLQYANVCCDAERRKISNGKINLSRNRRKKIYWNVFCPTIAARLKVFLHNREREMRKFQMKISHEHEKEAILRRCKRPAVIFSFTSCRIYIAYCALGAMSGKLLWEGVKTFSIRRLLIVGIKLYDLFIIAGHFQ